MKKYIICVLMLYLAVMGTACTNNSDTSSTISASSNLSQSDSETDITSAQSSENSDTESIDESMLTSFNSPNAPIYIDLDKTLKKKGNIVIAEYYNNDLLVAAVYYQTNIQEYIFNEDGTPSKMTVFDSEGVYGGFIEFKYENKLCTEQYLYSSESIIIEHQVFEYDDDGNVIKESSYNSKNQLDYYNIYEYKDGENVGSAMYDSEGNYISGLGTLAKS